MRTDAVAGFDLRTTLRFAEIALAALGDAREEIDALNVYPVPDGDTGTNLFLTFEAACDLMHERLRAVPDDLAAALDGFARGALLGARGNSGVILSQMAGAVTRRLASAGPSERPAAVLAEAMAAATEASYAAVARPVEGTILSVARAAGDAARTAAADSGSDLGGVVRAAAGAAREALARTREQLPALRDAGVVDAGGRGLCVILDAAETAVTGRRRATGTAPLGTHRIPMPVLPHDLTEGGPAYEVMYLLDAADTAVDALRTRLDSLGSSLVVVGGDGLWNVHVHVDDVGAAIEAGLDAGRPHRISVTHFDEQRGRGSAADTGAPPQQPTSAGGAGAVGRTRSGRTVVASAAGQGVADLFTAAGAAVVTSQPYRRPSTGQLLEAVLATGAGEVILLPNDPDSVATAEAASRLAAEEKGVRVAVVPTHAQVQGLAALAVHEPGRTFEQDVLAMTAAARHARSGAVTVAAKRAITTAGPCEPGDVLGAIEGDFVVVGGDVFAVAVEVLERLLGGGGELVTLLAGEGGGDLAHRCAEHICAHHPTVDVVVYDGGQERYPLLVAVE